MTHYLKNGDLLDYFAVDDVVYKLYQENIDCIRKKEPASLQVTCMYALHKLSCFNWNAIYAEGILPPFLVRAFVRYSVLRHPVTWIAYDILRLYNSLHGGSELEINFMKNIVRENSIEYTRISRSLETARHCWNCIFCGRNHVVDKEDPDLEIFSSEIDLLDYRPLFPLAFSFAQKLAQRFMELKRVWRKSYNYVIVNYKI